MAGKKPNEKHVPRGITRKLLQAGARGAKRVVVVFKNGVPSTVRDFDKYLKSRERAKQVKPWEFRSDRIAAPDPLGAVEGDVVGPLGRDAIYE